jgi:5-(carboxyamino)imidazole ribonucleotide synthase
MLAMAGHPLGLAFRFVDPDASASAGAIAELIRAEYTSAEAMAAARDCDVVTFEFENVPVAAARELARNVMFLPPPEALEVAQDRLLEKTCFVELGIETPRFEAVASPEELDRALERIGTPAVLKARRQGYDGKGQSAIDAPARSRQAWERAGSSAAEHGFIVEQMVAFERELSIIAVRGRNGETRTYPLIENHHAGGILSFSVTPAPRLTAELQSVAADYAARLLARFDYVGVLTLELFDVGGRLLANEFAPRVHNSGHLTIEGAETSQFENHLRAILGFPLGSTRVPRPAGMLNLIGTMPERARLLEVDGAHLYDYGKAPRAGRKLGHVTLCRDTTDAVLHELESSKRALDE